jgi:hypothetical protein
MRKAGFTVAPVVFGVLTAGMLGAAVLAGPAARAASSSTCASPGNCFTLAFTSDGQPAGTAVGAHIASGFDSQGGPVKVEVVNSLGHVVLGSSVEVTVAIDPGSNPGGGSLSGTTTERAIGGIASFSDLSIDRPGIGYRLTASSPGITSATSAYFTIWGSLKPCSTTPCSASASSSTTTGTVTTSSATATEILGDGLGGVSYSCGGTYQPVSDPFSFDLFDSSGLAQLGAMFSGTLGISKSTVEASGHTGASTWQLCYASLVPFTALAGTSGTEMIGGVLYYTGLLPDCSSTQGAPCVEARNKDNAGDVIVTFLASGDMIVKG